MANTVQFLGYARASGRSPFIRVFGVSFTGAYAQDNAEVIDLAAAVNPNGLEDPQTPQQTNPFIPAKIVGHTLNGYQPELQIGGNGTPGSYGIRFWASVGVELAAGASYSADFPANAALGGYGQVLLEVQSEN